ncbi:MAG: excisionase family DNA-binding protein [Candidatus Nanopelagicales bacterium]
MGERVGVVWDDRFSAYDFGSGHPMAPVRVQLAMRLAAEFGLLTLPGVQIIGPVDPAEDVVLLRVHEAAYIDAVRRASDDPQFYDSERGLGTATTRCSPGMHEASARIAQGSRLAALAVQSGEVDHGVNSPEGCTTRCPARRRGSASTTTPRSRSRHCSTAGGARRVLDIDVHHGDGVQAIFWDDPRVLTISVHESPASLFPVRAGRAGRAALAPGSVVNVAPTCPGTGDQGWLRAIHAVVPDILNEFDPQFLVASTAWTCFEDPLAHLLVSVDGQRMAFEAVHRWAHRYAGGRWIALGGGGYEWVDVVPRAWAHLIAEAAGAPIDPQAERRRATTSSCWRRWAGSRPAASRRPPALAIPFDQGFNPDDAVDQAILIARGGDVPAVQAPPRSRGCGSSALICRPHQITCLPHEPTGHWSSLAARGCVVPVGKPAPARERKLVADDVLDPDPVVVRVRFITVAEVASLMRVSKMTVYRLVHSGERPRSGSGRSFRARASRAHLPARLVRRDRLELPTATGTGSAPVRR